MARDPNNSGDHNSSYLGQDDSEKSLVGKFKSIISNTPLSKWFGRQDNDVKSTLRRRDEDYGEVDHLQPPMKRAKFTLTPEDETTKSSDTKIKEKLLTKNYNCPEPVAGSSGLQSRKLLNNVNTPINSDINVQLFGSSEFLNGHKDSDSEESTSGYSSVLRMGSKEHVCQSEGSSKQHSPLQNNSPNRRTLFDTPAPGISNRTLFTDRTATPQQNTSMSSRRPNFNVSTFGSPDFIDQTLSTEMVVRSPFYSGSTMYGGASAYGNKFGKRAKDLRNSLKRSARIKPIKKNAESCSMVLGKTARKILETLEQYSTPVNDAKKIPVASKRVRLDTSLLGTHVGVSPYTTSAASSFNKELQVPTVPDLLKMKQKLQSSTEAVRQIATSSKSSLNKVPLKQDSATNTPKQDEPVAPTLDTVIIPQDKIVSVQKVQDIISQKEKSITVSKVDKPKEAIQNFSVPTLSKFDLIIPATVTVPEKLPENQIVSAPPKIPDMTQSAVTKKYRPKDQPITVTQFKFSDPLIVSENFKSIVAINNFKFSEPLSNLNKLESKNIIKQTKEKNNGQTIIENTLMDKFKPASGTWECSTCLIRNQKEKTKCVACETPKLKQQTENKQVKSFGEKFKMPDNMWECPVCMIRNSNDKTKCLACETPNPKSSALVTSSSSFEAKFKPSVDTWECSTCLIRNKTDVDKCAACETPKVAKPKTPSDDLVAAFKKKADEWECTMCMVRNSNSQMKCQCCEAAKPGSTKPVIQDTEKKSQLKFNFGIDKIAAAQFKFGIQPTTTSSDSVTKLPDSANPKVAPITPTVPTFTFGIQKEANTLETATDDVKSPVSSSTIEKSNIESVVPSEKNTDTTTKAAVSKPTFSFDTEKKSAEIPTTKSETIPTFKFGNISKQVTSPTTSAFEQSKPTDISSTNRLNAQAKSTFATSSSKLSEVPLINKTEAKPFLFKSDNINTDSTNKVTTFNFGQTASSSTKPPTTQSSGFSFGQNTTATKSSESNFGQNTNSSAMTKSPGFNFGQSTAITQPSGFNFGSNISTNPAVTQSIGFNFQSTTKPMNFNFSAAGKTESGKLFAGTGTGSVSKNGIFSFGASNQSSTTTTQKTGFNFGGTSTTPITSFNIGAPTVTTQATLPTGSGFNFPSPYDANAKPTFNFTDGPVTFSSQPATGVPRKIKKAVRRTQR
ncbi:nuclear pore complex protein Nup153 [Diorhabda carinulata]|uniref:nuclear pore complex protein Nup153 n=1 Tax=Diorhabda carinulata TaxID=1163345 RepID=UPI0025A113E3|nr:nuclear pore complex protein Nup153 [Diorhabda carinulata]